MNKTKKVLRVTFSDPEIGFIGSCQLEAPLGEKPLLLLASAAKEIDKAGETDFSGSLERCKVTFDQAAGKVRVVIFDNDRETMPVTVTIHEEIEWDEGVE